MIKVWTDAAESSLLDQYGQRGSTFAYLPDRSAAIFPDLFGEGFHSGA